MILQSWATACPVSPSSMMDGCSLAHCTSVHLKNLCEGACCDPRPCGNTPLPFDTCPALPAPAPCSKVYGHFDWELSRLLHKDPAIDALLMPGPYVRGPAPERVLALSPDVDLSRTRNLVEYKRIVAGLLQVGAGGL